MTVERLSEPQKRALAMIGRNKNGEAVSTVEATSLIDGQPWVHWQTLEGLERRGLVVREDWTAGTFFLTAEGRSVLEAGDEDG